MLRCEQPALRVPRQDSTGAVPTGAARAVVYGAAFALPSRGRRWLLLAFMLCLGACSDLDEPVTVDPGSDAAASAGGVRLSTVLGGEAASGFARARPGQRLRFPQDHGVHLPFRSEWWYLTLMLQDERGKDYGGQFTLFRQALAPPPTVATAGTENAALPQGWESRQLYMAHLAVTDVAGGRHLSAERFSRGHERLAGVRSAPFEAYLEDWRLETGPTAPATAAADPLFPLTLTARAEQFAWALSIDAGKPRVLQGDRGYSAKGPGQASFYYSYSRLPVSGTVEIDGIERTVAGAAWFDREWSTSVLSAAQVGWDWFALQFDDGREAMAFRLRRSDCQRDPYDHGVLVAADGAYRALSAEQFRLIPTRWWRPGRRGASAPAKGGCPEEQAGYPVAWALTLDGEQLEVTAALDDQRMTTSVPYWEGLVYLSRDGERIGRGFLEMTGYR